MATLDDIGQEKQRIAERLARLDSEREKLNEQLTELQTAERVLSRFGKPEGRTTRQPRAARKAPAAAEAEAPRAPARRRGRAAAAAAKQAVAMPLSEATLRAVEAHPEGASAVDVRDYLAREFGMQVRPNHLGMALQRHRRAGRLEMHDSRWWPAQDGNGAMASAS